MLTSLSIRNIVLIEACDVSLGRGLCVLTGETGAGKSILLDALGLVLGARADASLLRHGEAQGSVAAEYDVQGNAGVAAVLAELGLEAADVLLIRRTLSADGKTRCFVNDAPVSVGALKKIGECVVEICGQHEQRGLLEAAAHRTLLDAFGKHEAKLAAVATCFTRWKAISEELATCREQIAQARREEEFLRHMVQELSQLAPEAGEEERLVEQRTLMMQSEKLFETLNEALRELQSGKGAAGALRSAQRVLMRSALATTGRFSAAVEALDKAAEEAELAEQTLEELGRTAPYDAERLERVEERLFSLRDAARKYHLPVEALPGLLEEAEAKLATLAAEDTRISALTAEEATAKAAYVAAAAALSSARAKAAEKLQKRVEAELQPLKMAGTRFRALVSPAAESAWSAHGVDVVTFEAATNVSSKADVPYAPIAKIASGGELSRFMLALKVAMSGVRSVPTLIFDEIDTGTGGAVADAIGERLAQLGEEAQVLVVTHLPQVAARGQAHLHVSKEEKKGRVHTSVVALSAAERKEELARMLSGRTITTEARKAAVKLLESA